MQRSEPQSEYLPSTQVPFDKRTSTLSLTTKNHDSSEYAINRFSQKYESYQEFLYRTKKQRRRLSSTGDNSGDSSTTTSGGSTCGDKEDTISDARTESDEVEREERKPLEGQITDAERQQVETFFKGLKTQIFVSNSLANLYTRRSNDSDWQLNYTGIPVIILDVGECKARDKRKIQIALSERGTCFMLWSDIIDNLSSYKVDGASFHTMCYSCDHTLQVGFSFDTTQAAEEMWGHIERLVACPENISLSTPGKNKKKNKEKKQSKPPPLPPKNHISQPCCFQHITSINSLDHSRYFSLRELLPKHIVHPRIHQIKDM